MQQPKHTGCMTACATVFTTVLVSGCASHTPHPPYELSSNLPEALQQPAQQSIQKWLANDTHAWWLTFADSQLSQHIDTALQQNLSLQAAWQRVQAVRALSQRVSSNRYPSVTATGGVRRQVNIGSDDRSTSGRYSAGVEAAYEVDVWGSAKARRMAQALRTQVSEQAYQGAALTLSVDVANLWIQLIEAQQALNLQQKQLATSNKVLKLLKLRFEVGQANSEDILRQHQVVASLEAEQTRLQANIQVLRHQLALLQGKSVDTVKSSASTWRIANKLPKLSPIPKQGIPITLLQRRPDVQQAYLTLLATDKTLAGAVRDQYPKLSLSASSITQVGKVGDLFTQWLISLVGNIAAPIFDGGQRRAEVARTTALRDEQVANYQQAVLQAITEIENALVNERQQQALLANAKKRLQLATSAYERIELRYLNGGTDFLTLLNAQNQKQALESMVLSSQAALVTDRVTLYRSIAGTW